MLKRRISLVAVMVLLSFVNRAVAYVAVAYVYPGSPNCPWADLNKNWAQYLNKEYGDKLPFFSIRFTRSVGTIEGGRCYTVKYFGKETWEAGGKIRDGYVSSYTGQAAKSQGGDPLKYQINVWGARFTYNEAGEVFLEADGKLAGNMYCHVGSECDYGEGKASIAPPVPKDVWESASETIAWAVVEGKGAEAFEIAFLQNSRKLSSALEWKFKAIADELEALFTKYLHTRDPSTLSALQAKIEQHTRYVQRYESGSIPNYQILGGLWLAALQERKPDVDSAAVDSKYAQTVNELVSFVESQKAVIHAEVMSTFSPIRRVGKMGMYTWAQNGRAYVPFSKSWGEADDKLGVVQSNAIMQAERSKLGHALKHDYQSTKDTWEFFQHILSPFIDLWCFGKRSKTP
jgi:hypothetical protein